MSKTDQLQEKLLGSNSSTKSPFKAAYDPKQDKKTLLSRIDDIQSSKDFLEECTYFIELNQLYEVHSTCSYNENMPYCPILVKITCKKIRDSLKANYLLQVWRKGGRKVYELPLQDKLSMWTIAYDTMIFKTSAQDKNSDKLHLYNFKHKSMHYVRDFANDATYKHVTFSHNAIYMANSQNILVGFVHLNDSNAGQEVELHETLTIPIDPKRSKVHGLFIDQEHHKHHDHHGAVKYNVHSKVVVALETNDQQIDFNFIKLHGEHAHGGHGHGHGHHDVTHHTYKLVQFREIIPKKKYSPGSDPIVSFQAVYNAVDAHHSDLVAVVQRKSGSFDLYYSGQRVYSSKKVAVRKIDLTYDGIYFLMAKDYYEIIKDKPDRLKWGEEPEVKYDLKDVPVEEQRIRLLDLKWKNEISYENSSYKKGYTLDNLFFQRIKKFCKLFSCFCMVGTVLIISHGNMISMFSVITNQWINHFFYASDIWQLFRNHNEQSVTVLFSDQSISVLRQVKKANTSEDQEPWEDDRDRSFKIEDKLVDVKQDVEDNKMITFITEKKPEGGHDSHAHHAHSNHHQHQHSEPTFDLGEITTVHQDKYQIQVLYDKVLYDISDQFTDVFHAKPNIVFLYSIEEDTEFIVQHGHCIDLYRIHFEEEKIEGADDAKSEEIADAENEQDGKVEAEKSGDEESDDESKKSSVQEEEEPKKLKAVLQLVITIDVSEKDSHGHIIKGKNHIHSKVTDGIKFQKHDTHHHHNAHPTQYLLLSDHTNFYKIDMKTHNVKTFQNQNSIGMIFADQNYLYSLCHKAPGKPSGLRLYDMENVIEHDQDYSLLLTNDLQVGCQGFIDFSHENERLIFQSSFELLEVIPLLHRNTQSFIGMKDRQSFIATKKMGGRFVALSNKGKLYSWDVITGKPIADDVKAPSYKQYKDFEIYTWKDADTEKEDTVYKKEWYSKILLRSKEPLKNVDESQYHGHGGSEEHLDHQETYHHSIKKEFYQFKVIEIISPTEVKEHLSFVHCIQPNSMNYIYFSSDLKYMYERLKFERHFLYLRVDQQDGVKGLTQSQNEVTWKQIHRFHKLPLDFVDLTEYPFIFSPSFRLYLDMDDTHTKFIIRNAQNHEKKVLQIPDELMNIKNEEAVDIVRRFRWVNERVIHLISHEGIERFIDIEDGFKEIEFNFIPLYDKEICKKMHYILDPPSYLLHESLKTLMKRYQYYKSGYYMKRALNPSYDLYEEIFFLDYRIDNCKGQFETDMSFSFLSWNLIEQLHHGKIGVQHLDEEIIEMMYYNILPHGNTVLHIIHDNGDLMEELLQAAHQDKEDRSKITIHIPFLPNMEGQSPIHKCVESQEYRYINVILEYLAGYDIDHHSRAIVDCLSVMVEHELPNFIPYLESRIKQTEIAKKITKGMLLDTNAHGICATSLWIGKDAIDKLFQPAPIEQDVRLQYVDIPRIHDISDDVSKDFMGALADSEDMKLFETTAIKKLIEFQWPIVLKYTILRLLVPFILFLSTYTTYIHGYFSEENDFMKPDMKVVVGIMLAVFASYILIIEAFQLLKNGIGYFFEVWNYLDFLPPTLILVFLELDFSGYFDAKDENGELIHLTTKATLQATMSLLIWLKFLYFLRIFESTGYLIRIIIQVCIDMRHFILLLFLTFIAFGEAIQSISDTTGENNYTGYLGGIGYVYRMVLGDFSVDDFDHRATLFMWILFIACTVLVMIIMMNLLIAIISESFAAINEVSKQANYRERAKMISENLYLVPAFVRNAFTRKNTYLLMAIDTEQELLEHEETIDSKIKKLQENIEEHTEKQMSEIKEQLEEIQKHVDASRNLANKLAGSKFGGSIINGSQGRLSVVNGGHH